MARWRRSRGRHALGAAVTSIPAVPPATLAPAPSYQLPPVRPRPGAEPSLPASDATMEPAATAVLSAPLDWSFPELAPPPAHVPRPAPVPREPPAGPRVELTFRDGTTAALDAAQAQALAEMAQLLTRRDEVKR